MATCQVPYAIFVTSQNYTTIAPFDATFSGKLPYHAQGGSPRQLSLIYQPTLESRLIDIHRLVYKIREERPDGSVG